jgi:feruloyl esterase
LPNTTITEARTIPTGDVKIRLPVPVEATARLPAHCRVTGSIRPTSDSDIRFEIWLPASGWNHRYQQVGNGGLAGSIPQFAMVGPLLGGYATAGTDDGHESTQGFDAGWAVGHPEKLIDYGYRAVHLTAQVGEALVQAYYDERARHTYFIGCSDGGRESLMEAQRFPQDFDGYLVGAPGIDIPNNEVGHLHVWQELHSLGPDGQLTAAQLATLSAKGLERCDALDGLKDGQLRDPRQCAFKATEAICSSSSGGSCLTAAQARAVQSIYDGARDSTTGQQLTPGDFGTLGTEVVTWPVIFLATPSGPALISATNEVISTLLYANPKLDMVTVNVAQAARDAKRKLAPIINSDNPDLRVARSTGRKILQYHGWADPNVRPQYSIEYFEAVQRFLGSDTKDFYRLFMVPGMAHCSGGVGPTSLSGVARNPVPHDPEHDWISALEHWVEDGIAPEQMVATEFKLDRPLAPLTPTPPGTPIKRTRPLCPYPRVAVYQGTGDPDNAASFRCEAISRK